jgi:hypothetical protein
MDYRVFDVRVVVIIYTRCPGRLSGRQLVRHVCVDETNEPENSYSFWIPSESFYVVADPFYSQSLVKQSSILWYARGRKAWKPENVNSVAL